LKNTSKTFTCWTYIYTPASSAPIGRPAAIRRAFKN
jgi:hypothetical protein